MPLSFDHIWTIKLSTKGYVHKKKFLFCDLSKQTADLVSNPYERTANLGSLHTELADCLAMRCSVTLTKAL